MQMIIVAAKIRSMRQGESRFAGMPGLQTLKTAGMKRVRKCLTGRRVQCFCFWNKGGKTLDCLYRCCVFIECSRRRQGSLIPSKKT